MEKITKLNILSKEVLMNALEQLGSSNDTILTLFHESCCKEESREATMYLWKGLGLILCDGNFSALVKDYRTITFRGVTKCTAIAVMMTFLPLCAYLRVRRHPQSTGSKDYFNISILSKGIFRKRKNLIIQLLKSLIQHKNLLNNLDRDYLSALFAGIIDGDGYVGKEGKYLAVTMARGEIKGDTIYSILTYLKRKGFIELGTYRKKPSYEITFKFLNRDFAENCLKLVFHPIREARLARYLRNYAKNYECSFTAEELRLIIMAAHSAYIQKRKAPRKSKVLIMYLTEEALGKIEHIWLNNFKPKPKPIKNRNRIVVKISEKCKHTLKDALSDFLNSPNRDSKVISTIREFITS